MDDLFSWRGVAHQPAVLVGHPDHDREPARYDPVVSWKVMPLKSQTQGCLQTRRGPNDDNDCNPRTQLVK
eukprot:6173433-Pleurochrysis_carterae.AAC.3